MEFFLRRIIMKKFLALLMAMMMIVTLAACTQNDGNNDGDDYEDYIDNTVVKTFETFGDDTFYFDSVDSETVTITGFNSTNDAPHVVKIPAYVDVDAEGKGRRVVGVSKEAFCYKSNITTVVFPTAEEYQAGSAEFDLSKHTFVIEDYAFRDCAVFNSVTIPAYVTALGKGAFYGCSKLSTVTFAEGCKLAELKESTFMRCSSLTNITLPGNIAVVGQAAFFECTALESVAFAEGVSIISKQAFQNCKKLASIQLPESVESIGQYAFHGSNALYLGGITYAGDSAEVLTYIQSLLLEEAPEVDEDTTGDETTAGDPA